MRVILDTPKEFSFELCLQFLQRSPNEVLHFVEDRSVRKLLRVKEKLIPIELSESNGGIEIEFISHKPTAAERKFVLSYVTEWFDLATDLRPFYKMAKADDLLCDLVKKYYGYRIVGQSDLFESLVWAVLGQQINVQFAHTLKRRFVEQYGTKISVDGKDYFLFPEPAIVSQLDPTELMPLQFSNQKARYTVGIAEAFVSGMISKEKLAELTFDDAKDALIKIKGVGNWTANYALMKTFRYPNAFPLEDVGIHNAIKNRLGMKEKPSLRRVERIFKKYKGWEAYATLYLWKSL